MLEGTQFALLRRVATEQASARVPSLVAAVIRRGRIAWSGHRGYLSAAGGSDGGSSASGSDGGTVAGDSASGSDSGSDGGGHASPDDDTQYRIGSITKPFVATLVLRLRDEGRLELGDRLAAHVPNTALGDLSIAALLSHTSGLTAESPGSWWERSPGAQWPQLAASLGPGELKHRAGSRFHYSNVGYGALGELIARKRGSSWLAAVHTELLEPLGMTRTTAHPQGKHAEGFAVHPYADVVLPEPTPDAGAMAPAGQLWSTAADLARFTAFLGGALSGPLLPGPLHPGPLHPGPLHPDTLAEMRQVAAVDAGGSGEPWVMGYGLGIQLARSAGRVFAGHTGSMPGFLASAMIDPATGTGALVMGNSTSGLNPLGLVLDLITLADEHEPVLPEPWRPSPVDPALLALTGLWFWGPAPFRIRVCPDGLLDLAPASGSGRASRFRPLGDDRWEGLDGYYAGETLRVARDASGAPHYLDLATFVFTRAAYDPTAPIPGGVDERGWRA